MMNETPEAALRSRIADLEQQLKLADEGTSRLAQRCLELEKQLQTFYAAHPQKERQTDSPALVQPLLYYDAGFGFSQKDTVKAPDYEYDELNGMVTATFELPEAAFNLRLDPGELPCCITDFVFSDDRILCRPVNGVPLPWRRHPVPQQRPEFHAGWSEPFPRRDEAGRELLLLPAGAAG